MKYVILLCDGMADHPIESLGGRTPLEAAHNPSMNWLAQTATVGMVRTVPEGMTRQRCGQPFGARIRSDRGIYRPIPAGGGQHGR